MSEIKPVHLRLSKFHELEVCHGSIESAEPYYPAAAYEALKEENADLKDDLQAYQSTNRHLDKASIDLWLKNDEISKANAAQAKRIAELEEKVKESFVVNADKNLVIFGSKESIHAMNGLALEAMELRAKVAELDNKLHERTVTSGAKIHELNSEIESLRKQVKLHEETQSNELIKLRETVQFLEDKQREVSDILLLRIDPIEIIKRAGSALVASKNGEPK